MQEDATSPVELACFFHCEVDDPSKCGCVLVSIFGACFLGFAMCAAEEARVRVPCTVCRGAAGSGSAFHQHLSASSEGPV